MVVPDKTNNFMTRIVSPFLRQFIRVYPEKTKRRARLMMLVAVCQCVHGFRVVDKQPGQTSF